MITRTLVDSCHLVIAIQTHWPRVYYFIQVIQKGMGLSYRLNFAIQKRSTWAFQLVFMLQKDFPLTFHLIFVRRKDLVIFGLVIMS